MPPLASNPLFGTGGAPTASNPVLPNLYPKDDNVLLRDFTPMIRHQYRR